jgi:metal-responsive CopG/Arc/MetJ family transcriptional regulator
MKTKTSVTLSSDLVRALDKAAHRGESRSAAIERLLREGLGAQARRAADARDRALIDRQADALNAQVQDVLEYQADQ